jgi:guanylate kinase
MTMTVGQRRGLLFILSSPSGAGKSTLARRLRAWDPTIRFSVSATTRAARPGEVDGRDYHFVSKTKFREMVAAGEMLEHAEVFGHLYGSPRAPVEAARLEGADTLFDIDWQGGQQIKQAMRSSRWAGWRPTERTAWSFASCMSMRRGKAWGWAACWRSGSSGWRRRAASPTSSCM